MSRATTAEQRAAGRPCSRCRHFERDNSRCRIHDRATATDGTCEDWNRVHIALGTTSDKYMIRSMTPEIADQPLVKSARGIAQMRGYQTGSARWWTVLHYSHERLQEAHLSGQQAALDRVRQIVERLRPAGTGRGLSAPEQAAADAYDAVLRLAQKLEPELPETPSTGRKPS